MDIGVLKEIGQFCVDYGPWAVVVFEGAFIIWQMRIHRSDRKEWEQKRLEERSSINNTFEEHRKDMIEQITKYEKVKASVSQKLININKDVRSLRKTIVQFLQMKSGTVVIDEQDDKTMYTTTDFLDNGK